MRPVTFVKWGGSLITDKAGRFSVRADVLTRLAGELARYRAAAPEAPLVLGHGSGSFGHVAAREAGITGSAPPPDAAQALSRVQAAATRLHQHVVQALRDAGLPVFSFAPSSAALSTGGTPNPPDAAPVHRALSLGALPVTYGDVFLDTDGPPRICSTEAVFQALIAALRDGGTATARVVWCGGTNGVYDGDGATLPVLSPDEARALAGDVHAPHGTDVTGGMALRLRTASALATQGIDSLLVNGAVAGRLTAALQGTADAHRTHIVATS